MRVRLLTSRARICQLAPFGRAAARHRSRSRESPLDVLARNHWTGRPIPPAMTSAAPRRRPATPQAQFTVEAILEAAERILERSGPTGLTTNHVAELAGVSIGSLYQYFPNKEALVGALQDRYAEDTLSRVRAVIRDPADKSGKMIDDAPLDLLIVRIANAVLQAKQAQRPIHRWLIEWRSAVGGQDRYRAQLDQLVAMIAELLAHRCQPEPATVAFVIVHAVEGIIEAVTSREINEAQEIARATALMITAYVAAGR
jgi:AcrR family transcriptional regulator